MAEEHRGVIIHASYDSGNDATRIFLVGRLVSGESCAIILQHIHPGFWIRESDVDTATSLSSAKGITRSTGYTTLDRESVARVVASTVSAAQRLAELYRSRGIRCYESDLRIYDQYLLDRGIFGPFVVSGSSCKGRHVDRVFIDPDLSPSDEIPPLSVCSLDIENDPATGVILSVALAHRNPFTEVSGSEVIYSGNYIGPGWVQSVADEHELLTLLLKRIREIDPDVITGWNVIEYDFRVIAERLAAHAISFDAGRSDREAVFMPGGSTQSSAVIIPGRQVVDGMRVMRSSQERFFDNRLETVAQAVLGSGKVVLDGPKVETILRMHREEPLEFCTYNRRDAELVIEILDTSTMFDLTVRRAMLTGLPLSRAWTSVSAFEHLYVSRMHEHRIVAPDPGTDAHPVGRAPGGAIIPPKPGVYRDVLVFDFKSLYPSIMRTLNIDPVAYLPPDSIETDVPVIEAPNGAAFRRDLALLPDILATLFARREEAKAAGDAAASYVYKIIMNSFYGVLGTAGCRFAATEIAGAITSFGHEFLGWCRKHFESLGFQVLYGDTDSLFVHMPEAGDDPSELARSGARIAEETTSEIAGFVRRNWQVESHLVLEYECLYRRFFLPALRGAASSSSVREVDVAALQGRAKGYAGLTYDPDAPGGDHIEIKGMEAVRRDWTEAAKRLQRKLLAMVFADDSTDAMEKQIIAFVDALIRGEMDRDLVYHKALRKPVDSYNRSKPPHVKAAMQLPPSQRRGVVSYVWTVEGPQPVGGVTASIDYAHYIEKQLQPIADGIGDVLGRSFARLFNRDPQRELFG